MSMMQTGTVELSSNSPSEVRGNQTSTFTRVIFPTPFPQGSQVIVIPFVQTFHGPDTPGLRIADVTIDGFLIRMNEVVAAGRNVGDGQHTTETIGWVAHTV